MRLFAALALFLLTQPARAQREETSASSGIARNTIYAEGLGNGWSYSINYDRIFLKKEKFALAGRLGAGFTPTRYRELLMSLPVEICPLVGKHRHFFETGAGFTFIQMLTSDYEYEPRHPWIGAVTLRAGYRFQKPDGGIFFRAGFLLVFPAVSDENTEIIRHVAP